MTVASFYIGKEVGIREFNFHRFMEFIMNCAKKLFNFVIYYFYLLFIIVQLEIEGALGISSIIDLGFEHKKYYFQA